MGIVARQSSKAAISNYLGILLGFLNLFILFPYFYAPKDLGAIRLLLETGVIISSFALVGTNYSINRFFPYFKTEDKKHNGFFFWAFVIPVVGYALVFIGLIFFRHQLLSFFKTDSDALNRLYPMLLSLVFFSLFQTVLETCNANHGRIAVPNFLREVFLRIIILSGGFLYYLKWVSFETSVWIIVGSYSLVVVFNFFYLRTLTLIHLKPDFEFLKQNKHIVKDVIQYTSLLFLGGLTGLIIGKIDFLMISAQRNLADTAIYSIGFYLALLIEIPKRTILQISNPIISGHMKENNMVEVQKMYRQIPINQLLAASILFFLIWLNIDNLFQIMPRGDFYKSGKTVVFLIGIGRLIDMIGSAAGPVMANSKFYFYSITNFVVAFLVAITANLILIPRMGINGAALGTILTFFCSQSVAIYIIYRKTGLHPFAKEQLYIFLILILFLLPTLAGKWFFNPFLDGAIRTIVLGVPFIWILYKLKLSVEFSQMVDKILAKYITRKSAH
jgi:O-antigen/teichoic acid export membrane protein